MTTQELREKIRAMTGSDPELLSYQANRLRDKNRQYLPHYHFASPGGYLNDPCGYCFFKGVWHLFYQFSSEYLHNLSWGHAVSVDRVHWLDLPAAITPDFVICCGSGGACVDGDRVIACYQGDLTERPGGAIHIMESTDELLVRWRRVSDGPAITTFNEDGSRNPYNAFDPCMWKEGDTFFLLSAGGGSLPHPIESLDYRHFYLFTSRDLVHWEYHHSFAENDRFNRFGDDGACPYFLPIGKKHLLMHFSHMSGGQLILGEYDRQRKKFVAEQGMAMNVHSWMAGGVHAPSACPDEEGRVHAIFNVNYGLHRGPENQIMSLPLLYTLDGQDALCVQPDGDLASLRSEPVHLERMTIPANKEVVLPGISGTSLELKITADAAQPREASPIFTPTNLLPLFELRVLRSPDAEEYTAVRFFRNRSKMTWDVYRNLPGARWADAAMSVVEVDASSSTLSADVAIHPTESQEFFLPPDKPIELRVFVDRSIVEVFAGDKAFLSMRTYPSREDSRTVSVLSKGVDAVVSCEAWRMDSIYPD